MITTSGFAYFSSSKTSTWSWKSWNCYLLSMRERSTHTRILAIGRWNWIQMMVVCIHKIFLFLKNGLMVFFKKAK